MTVKPGDFNLFGWQNRHEPARGGGWKTVRKDIQYGLQVCSANNTKILGKVVDIGPVLKDRYSETVHEVTIFWQTGPRKGTAEKKRTADLVNYEAYKAYIVKLVKDLDANEEIAKQAGM